MNCLFFLSFVIKTVYNLKDAKIFENFGENSLLLKNIHT